MSQYFISPSSFGVPAPIVGGQGAWTEVGRTTLGAPGDDITVSGLPNKEFYMFLVDIEDSPDIQLNIRLGDGGVDSGANYASRESNNGLTAGVSDNLTFTNANQIELSVNSVTSLSQFGFGYINNLFGHEKLVSFRGNRNEDGVAVGTFRSQVAGKWSNLTPLDTLNLFNAGTGSFPTGSELVVLGWSRFDPQLPNFWNLLGEVTQVTPSNSLVTPIFAKKKYLISNYQMFPDGTSVFGYAGRFGDTTVQSAGNNYHGRSANSSFADQLQSGPGFNINAFGDPSMSQKFIINKAGQEKMHIGQATSNLNNAPPQDIQRNMESGKNGEATLKAGQIDIFDAFQTAGTELIQAGSKITVWGSD